MVKAKVLIIIFSFLISAPTFSQKPWQEIVTSRDLTESYPEFVKKLFDQLDMTNDGLAGVNKDLQKGNLTQACDELLEYYKKSSKISYLRSAIPEKSTQRVAVADTILKNVFYVQNVRGKVKVGPDGHRDWYYKGPNNDREWAWLSNRHTQLLKVFKAYQETGNPEYAVYIDEFLRDFIIKSMPYPAKKSRESIWRGLEVAARVKVWTQIFYGLQQSEYLQPATRLLMLASLPDHAHYNKNFHAQNNWLTMETTALATFATHFEEFKNTDKLLEYSIETMLKSLEEQIYPDGVQTELTSHYHRVSLLNFELLKTICDRVNKPLPESYNRTLEQCYAYLAHTMRPDGSRILNNDGDRGSDVELVLKGATIYKNDSWKYIATNGKEGSKPTTGPSFFFPYAGQLISRSDFEQDAHWSFFDMGPWGSGHQHNDKLHLSVHAYGQDFLVDAGRFAYTGATAQKYSGYARGSEGHNVILIDGQGQSPGPKLATAPLSHHYAKITQKFDYASHSIDTFKDVKGEAIHTRSMMYVRDNFWIVADRITTDRPRDIEMLWHWHPDLEIKVIEETILGKGKSGSLSLIPVGHKSVALSFTKGQEKPGIQGWYSESYNIFEPNLTSSYHTGIPESTNFVWLIVPTQTDKHKVTAKVISSNKKEVSLQINSPRKQWEVTIPFENSDGVKFKENMY